MVTKAAGSIEAAIDDRDCMPLLRRAKRSRPPKPSSWVGAETCLVEAKAVSRFLSRITASSPCCHLATWASEMSRWGRL